MKIIEEKPNISSQTADSGNKEFYKILDYIKNHYTENITVESISKALYCSRSRTMRLFAKHLGVSVKEYITDLRIKKANELLALGYSVTETAMESGFQSVRIFNSSYKAYMGITPTQYQKSIK